MGNSGEPCGTPALSWRGAVSTPSTISVVFRSVKKLCISCTAQSGTRLACRLSRSRMWLTVSNALAMSNDRTDATWSFSCQTVWICSSSRSNAVSVDLFLRFPIWVSGSRPSCSANAPSLRAKSVSISFPIVLKSAIGLHAPGSE